MIDNSSMGAMIKAQEMILAKAERDDIEMYLIKNFPSLNEQGLIPTIVRRAYKDCQRFKERR